LARSYSASHKTPTLTEILDSLRAGRTNHRTLYGLSNLERSQAEQVWAVWSGLPVATRRKMAQMMVEIAESDFEVNFDEVFRLVLEDPDATVRLAAVDGLWENEDIRLVPVLANVLLNDPAAEVRAAAAISLGRFMLSGELGKIRPRPHQQAFQALLAACTNEKEDLEVRRRALRRTGQNPPPPPPAGLPGPPGRLHQREGRPGSPAAGAGIPGLLRRERGH